MANGLLSNPPPTILLYDPRCPSMDEQVEQFLTTTNLSSCDYEKRKKMLTELSEVLGSIGIIHPFGSYLTGIGSSSSDVDIFFDDSGKRDKIKVLREVELLIKGAKSPSTGKKFGEIIKKLLNTRIPLLTFIHCDTLVTCDVSFENILSVQNSKLLKFYFTLDPIVKPLVKLLRYWAKYYNLIDSRRGLKNYAIVLLVLTYLIRMKIVPSVELLQSLVPPLTVPGYDGLAEWNCAFCDDPVQVQQAMVSRGIGRLSSVHLYRPSHVLLVARDFLYMVYGILQQDLVICPLTGDLIPRSAFLSGKLPPSQDRYTVLAKKLKKKAASTLLQSETRIILQDPFDLGFSVTQSVSQECFMGLHRAIFTTLGNTDACLAHNGELQLLNFFLPPTIIPVDPVKDYLVLNGVNITTTTSLLDPQYTEHFWTTDINFTTTFTTWLSYLWKSSDEERPSDDLIRRKMLVLWFGAAVEFFEEAFDKDLDYLELQPLQLVQVQQQQPQQQQQQQEKEQQHSSLQPETKNLDDADADDIITKFDSVLNLTTNNEKKGKKKREKEKSTKIIVGGQTNIINNNNNIYLWKSNEDFPPLLQQQQPPATDLNVDRAGHEQDQDDVPKIVRTKLEDDLTKFKLLSSDFPLACSMGMNFNFLIGIKKLSQDQGRLVDTCEFDCSTQLTSTHDDHHHPQKRPQLIVALSIRSQRMPVRKGLIDCLNRKLQADFSAHAIQYVQRWFQQPLLRRMGSGHSYIAVDHQKT